jgi:hypothetical protein
MILIPTDGSIISDNFAASVVIFFSRLPHRYRVAK